MDINILFCHSNWRLNIVFGHQYPILPIELRLNIVLGQQCPILPFELRPNILLRHQCTILPFELRANIVFGHQYPSFAIRTEAEYHIFQIVPEYRILPIQDHILPFKMRPNIVFGHQYPIELRQNIGFGHSKSNSDIRNQSLYRIWTSITYFDFLIEAEYRIWTLKILF